MLKIFCERKYLLKLIGHLEKDLDLYLIHRTNDVNKLIVSKNGKEYSNDAIRAVTEFEEKYFE